MMIDTDKQQEGRTIFAFHVPSAMVSALINELKSQAYVINLTPQKDSTIIHVTLPGANRDDIDTHKAIIKAAYFKVCEVN